MARVIIYALLSTISAYGCVCAAVMGLLTLLFAWPVGLALLFAVIPLAAAAAKFDRLKLRTLYGDAMGNLLHESMEQASADVAIRDLLAYRRLRRLRGQARHEKSHTDLPILMVSGPIAAVQRNNVDPALQEDDLKEDGAVVVGTKKTGPDQR